MRAVWPSRRVCELVDPELFGALVRALERACDRGVPFDTIWPPFAERAADCFRPRERALRILSQQRRGYLAAYESSRPDVEASVGGA